jgi:hypothetical protein
VIGCYCLDICAINVFANVYDLYGRRLGPKRVKIAKEERQAADSEGSEDRASTRLGPKKRTSGR